MVVLEIKFSQLLNGKIQNEKASKKQGLQKRLHTFEALQN